MESFGEYLRRERELRHIELDEISQTTKIKKSYLQAIENDAYEELPDIALVKGFIRAYCNYIGLNPEQTVNYFQQLYNEKFKTEIPSSQSFIKTYRLRILILTLAVLTLAMVIFILNHFSKQKNKEYGFENKKTMEQTTFSSTLAIKPTTPVATTITQSIASEPITRASFTATIEQHTLLLKATEDTWVRLVPDKDEKNAQEALLRSGDQLLWKFTGTALLTIGNAQGVEIFLDNKKIQHSRIRAEVIKLKLKN